MGGLGCDNMTVVLVCLLANQGWDNFVARCNRPRASTPPPPPVVHTIPFPHDKENNCTPSGAPVNRSQSSEIGDDKPSSPTANFVTPPRTPTKPSSDASGQQAYLASDQRVPEVPSTDHGQLVVEKATDAELEQNESPPSDFAAETADQSAPLPSAAAE